MIGGHPAERSSIMKTLQVKINCTKYSCGTCEFKGRITGFKDTYKGMRCQLFHKDLKLRTIRDRGVSYHRTPLCIDAEAPASPTLTEARRILHQQAQV